MNFYGVVYVHYAVGGSPHFILTSCLQLYQHGN